MGVRVTDVHLTIYVLIGKASCVLQTAISSINMTNKTCLACPSEVTVTIFVKFKLDYLEQSETVASQTPDVDICRHSWSDRFSSLSGS